MALYIFSGLPLRLSPTTVLCRSVVTVTVASSAPKALWVVVLYTMNNHRDECLTTDLQSSVLKLFTSEGHHTKPFGELISLLKKCCSHIKCCRYVGCAAV